MSRSPVLAKNTIFRTFSSFRIFRLNWYMFLNELQFIKLTYISFPYHCIWRQSLKYFVRDQFRLLLSDSDMLKRRSCLSRVWSLGPKLLSACTKLGGRLRGYTDFFEGESWRTNNKAVKNGVLYKAITIKVKISCYGTKKDKLEKELQIKIFCLHLV